MSAGPLETGGVGKVLSKHRQWTERAPRRVHGNASELGGEGTTVKDSLSKALDSAALVGLLGLLLVGAQLAPTKAAAWTALGMSVFAFLVGWRLRDRLLALPAAVYFGLAGLLAMGVAFIGNELHGASRWILPGEPLQVRGGLWVAVLYAAGLACMRANCGSSQRVMVRVAFAALVAIIIGLGAMPDLYSAFMLFAAALLVVWHRPHIARAVVSWLIGLTLAMLTGLIVSASYRVDRVAKGLRLSWISPESDPTGRGWAAIQTKVAMENAEWFGLGARSELPARLEWYGVTEMATQFGVVAAVLATTALAIFCAALLKRAIERRTEVLAEFWVSGAAVFVLGTLVAIAPAYGLLPYVGHWGVPFLSASDVCWFGALLAGALLMPTSRSGQLPGRVS